MKSILVILYMRTWVLNFLLVFSFSIFVGCADSTEDVNAVNVESNATNSVISPIEYSDANTALADGIKALDTGDTERAIEILNRAVELDPDLADAYFRLGIAHALIEFRDQITASESLESTPPPGDSDKKQKQEKSRSEIAFEKAVAAYKKRINTNKEDHAAYYNLGRSYNKLNEDEDAAKALREAVKLNPDDTEYQTELGSILIKLAKYAEAEAALKKAIELDENNLEAVDLLERAEAGRKRVSFTVLPKDPRAESSNSASSTADEKPEPIKPDPKPPVKPSPTQPPNPSLKPTPQKP